MQLYSATMILFLIMNPLGNIPIFLNELKKVDPKRFTFIILRETSIAFLVLAFFMFFGQYFLKGFQISTQALGVSGGIILFLIALRMIFPPATNSDPEKKLTGEPFFVPLAVPLTAGPGAMATVMLFVTEHPESKFTWFLAILIASVAFGVVLLSARYLSRFLGERGLIAMERLMGMVLTAMAIQMLLSGLDSYFRMH